MQKIQLQSESKINYQISFTVDFRESLEKIVLRNLSPEFPILTSSVFRKFSTFAKRAFVCIQDTRFLRLITLHCIL